jgi:hypothetical protein
MEFGITNQTDDKIILSNGWGSIPFNFDKNSNYESLLSVDGKNVFKFTIRFVNHPVDKDKQTIRPALNEIEFNICNDDVLEADGEGSATWFYCCTIDGSKVYFRFSFTHIARYMMIYSEYYAQIEEDNEKE